MIGPSVHFTGKMVQQYKGFAGSIRSIQCSPAGPVVASCGLDRYLRIHDVNTKQLLQKVNICENVSNQIID